MGRTRPYRGKQTQCGAEPRLPVIRRGGVSSVAGSGKVFFDPVAHNALIGALTETSSSAIEVATGDAGINDPAFASSMARKLHIPVDQTKAQRDDQG